MSPLFGNKETDSPATGQDAGGALPAEFARISSLSLPQLASEVMTKGFGPGGPGANDDAITVGGMNINAGPTVGQIAAAVLPGSDARGVDAALREHLFRIVAEGVQTLEHASLVRAQIHSSSGSLDYAATRLGRAALEQGAVDRILGGGTLAP